MIADLWQDLRFGARMLLKSPNYTLIAVITLALGIGANTAIFSALEAVLVQPLPYRNADRLVWLTNRNAALGVQQSFLNQADILDLRDQAKSFTQVASWGTVPLNLTGARKPERVEHIFVTPNFFTTLGVAPLLGRGFSESDGDSDNVIISYGLWQRQFGGDPNVIGRKIALGTSSRDPKDASVVVGVLPAEYQFPARVDVFTTYEYDRAETQRGGPHNDRTIALLQPGVTLAQAQAELNAIAREQGRNFPNTNAGWDFAVTPFRDYLFGGANVALPLLLGAVALVLLIACVNVTNLQLARASSRRREIAVRLALGAGRWRIVRQLLLESLLLAAVGGALGLLLAAWGVEALRVLGPDSIPRLQAATINAATLGFTAALVLLTSIVCGLTPALQSSQADLRQALKEAGSQGTLAPRQRRFRSLLAGAQIALATLLLAGAGLLLTSFWKLRAVNPGFQAERIVTAGLSTNFNDYHGNLRRIEYFRRALTSVSALPGVESAAAISHLPFGGRTMQLPFVIAASASPTMQPTGPKNEAIADYRVVTPGLFATLRAPIKQGRAFTERDTARTPLVYMVNEAFARAYFPSANPVGALIKVQVAGEGEIVGVTGDMRHRGLELTPAPAIYVCYLQHSTFPIMNFVVRTAVDPSVMGESVRRALQAVDSEQVVFNVRPLDQFLADSTALRRFQTLPLSLFAALALALAAAGVYGVMSYTVAERCREFAIRLALGAQGRDVLLLVLWQGLKLAALGALTGLAGAWAVARLLRGLLFGLSAGHPPTFAATAVVLMMLAGLACYLPARRATQVDPMIALRTE